MLISCIVVVCFLGVIWGGVDQHMDWMALKGQLPSLNTHSCTGANPALASFIQKAEREVACLPYALHAGP